MLGSRTSGPCCTHCRSRRRRRRAAGCRCRVRCRRLQLDDPPARFKLASAVRFCPGEKNRVKADPAVFRRFVPDRVIHRGDEFDPVVAAGIAHDGRSYRRPCRRRGRGAGMNFRTVPRRDQSSARPRSGWRIRDRSCPNRCRPSSPAGLRGIARRHARRVGQSDIRLDLDDELRIVETGDRVAASPA